MTEKKVCACTIWFVNQKKGVESGLAMEMMKNCVDLSGSMRRFSFSFLSTSPTNVYLTFCIIESIFVKE